MSSYYTRATKRGRGTGPTARTTISGDAADFLFLLLYSRGLNSVSGGVQLVMDDLLQGNADAQRYYDAAEAMVANAVEMWAAENGGEEPDRSQLWRFISDNLDRVMTSVKETVD